MKDYKYCFFPNEKDGNVVVVGYGYETFENKQIFSPFHKINHYSVHYVIKGEGTLFIEDKAYPLNKGAMFLCPKNTLMAYHTSKENPYVYYWINFTGDKAEEILQALKLSKESPVYYPENAEDIKSTFFNLVWETDKTSEYLALSALYKITHLVQNKNTLALTTSKTYCDKVIEYIKLNYKNYDLKISHIANALHVTPQYLSKVFSLERGESIVSYLISYRMNVARELLLSGKSVTEACFECGYVDLSNFSKTYKKTYGSAPSETLNNLTKNKE